MLCNGWTQTSTQKSKITVKGPSVNNTSVEGMPEKRTVVLSKWAKRKAKKRKMKKVANTVFKVSLPLTKGSVLLARMSFSQDSLPMSYSHSSASDLIPPPESQTEDCELDYDIGSFALNNEHTAMCTNSQLQQHLYSGDAEADQYKGPERIFTGTRYQEVDGSFSINEDSSQSEDITWKNDQKVYGDRNYDRRHGSQETSSMNFTEEFKNEGLQKQNEELLHAVSHIQDWSSYNSSYRPEEGYAVQWYNSASQNKVGTRVEVPREERQEMSSGSAQCYYKQQPQNQYMAADHTNLLTVDVEQHGLSGESSCLDAARIKMHPQLDFLAHSGSSAPQPRVQFLETEQRQLQTYMEFTANHVQTTPQSYMMQPVAYQTIYRGHGVMPNPNYSHVPMANPDHHFPHPGSSSSGGCGGGMSQSNAFIPPVQALCYGTYSDPNFRDTGLPGLMISRSVDGTTPFMCAYPNFNSAYIATPYGDHSSTQWSGVPIE
ncbi:uncharacterized protein LOC111659405 isoform X1 [Seriola lalandi dorsalis]|uniref:uncharacterized protein LOC111659405 isoform X1 n=1 Tax=Seriola lalandi dorsalis TaxID=1841481 RepID=UPI000C6FA027|nr:uncharacterized protein LOC111659405 isoform X1 [Seriola lalandi dorsalis]